MGRASHGPSFHRRMSVVCQTGAVQRMRQDERLGWFVPKSRHLEDILDEAERIYSDAARRLEGPGRERRAAKAMQQALLCLFGIEAGDHYEVPPDEFKDFLDNYRICPGTWVEAEKEAKRLRKKGGGGQAPVVVEKAMVDL